MTEGQSSESSTYLYSFMLLTYSVDIFFPFHSLNGIVWYCGGVAAFAEIIFPVFPNKDFLCHDLTFALYDVSRTSLEKCCMQRKKDKYFIICTVFGSIFLFVFNEAHQAQFYLFDLTLMSRHINFTLRGVCRSSAKLFLCQ